MTTRPRGKPPRPKTISPSGVTGQKGVNAIERVVLDMGSRWTPSGPNEIGIDGYIELFDPNSKQSLGLTLAVQSKVVSAIAADSGAAIEYWCDPDDLTYWLNGNTPVILVVSDGTPERSYWISITQYFKNWDRTKPTRVTFDRPAHRFNRDSFSQVAEIAASKTRFVPCSVNPHRNTTDEPSARRSLSPNDLRRRDRLPRLSRCLGTAPERWR